MRRTCWPPKGRGWLLPAAFAGAFGRRHSFQWFRQKPAVQGWLFGGWNGFAQFAAIPVHCHHPILAYQLEQPGQLEAVPLLFELDRL